jgi:hypothetical protein
MRTVWIAVLLTACSTASPPPDPNDALCTHYAKLMVTCEAEGSDPTVLRATAHNFCLKGMSGKHEQTFGARYRQMIECTRTAETCDALATCQAQ